MMNQLNYNNGYIILTPTVISNDVKRHHEKAIKDNFEGDGQSTLLFDVYTHTEAREQKFILSI